MDVGKKSSKAKECLLRYRPKQGQWGLRATLESQKRRKCVSEDSCGKRTLKYGPAETQRTNMWIPRRERWGEELGDWD